MKKNNTSANALNAYNDGFRRGIDIALQDETLNLKKINPYHAIFNRVCWEGFNNGSKDGFMQGIRNRENHRAFARLKELDKIKQQTKEQDRER